MKNLNFFLIGIITLAMFSSCKNSSDIKVGFLIPSSIGSRWVMDQKYVEDAAKEKGITMYVRSAENDENLQLKQAKELLDMGVDALIVVSANANTAAAIVRDAHAVDVPVIGYDRLIQNSDLDYLVTFDGVQIGKLMIDHALSKVPKGNYVILWGDAGDVNALWIKGAVEEALAPSIESGDVNIVYQSFVENWDYATSGHIMSRILNFSNDKIDAVITSYDGLAMGALDALNETDKPKFKVLTGQDCELNAVQSVANDGMTLTIYKSIATMADAAVDLAVKLVKGESIESATQTMNNGRKDVPLLLLNPIPVEKNTIRSVLIKDGFYTEEEIYGK